MASKLKPAPGGVGPERLIVTAARKHFMQHGYRSVTLDDLAKEVGMSKKTFYQYFSNKEALLRAVLDNKIADLERELGELLHDQKAGFPATLSALVRCLQHHASEISPSLPRDIAKLNPAVFMQLRSRRAALISDAFSTVLRLGQQSGAIRTDLDIGLMVEMLIHLADGLITPGTLSAKGLAPKDLLQPMLSLYLEGVLTEKGRNPS
jgi:AcrR family transcriptional regulator